MNTPMFANARLLPVMVLALFCTTVRAQASADGADAARRVFDQVGASVVTVKTSDGHGSGVVVAPGKVATNCHVVRDASSVLVLAGNSEFKAEWTRQLPEIDLCLLSVPDLKAAPVVLRPSATLAVGEPAYAVGNPLGFGLAVSNGLVTMLRHRNGGDGSKAGSANGDGPYPLLIATAPQSPGSSGGGLFDREGRLLGLTTAILGTGQNLNKIVVAEGITDLLARGTAPPPAVVVPVAEAHWIAEAEKLQAAAHWDLLERHGLAWTRAQPTAALAWVYTSIAQRERDRPEDANASIQRALALDDHLPFAWLILSRLQAEAKDVESAERALAQAEALWPAYSEPQRARAARLLSQGQAAAALVQIREAIRKLPERAVAWEKLGVIEEALGHNPEAIVAYRTALRLDGSLIFTKVRLVALESANGNTTQALRDGVLGGGTPADETQALLSMAEIDRKAGRLAVAEETTRKALALSPDSARAWGGLAVLLTATERLAPADEAIGKAIALEPKQPDWLAIRSLIRRARKQPELALADVRAALALAPANVFALGAFASLQLDAKKYDEANKLYAQANAITPLSSESNVGWADARLGSGDTEGALQLLRQVEAKNPVPPGLNLVMAKVLGRKSDLQAALVYVERALMAEPTNAPAWSSKGFALLKMNRLPEAAEALETAVRLDPLLANSWINLGEAQMRSLKLGRAIEALEKGLSLSPAALDARLFLAQTYMAARLPAKARQQGQKLLEQQPGDPPALGLITMAYLMEGNSAAAEDTYLKLKSAAPPTARYIRERAIAAGLTLAYQLPE